MLHLQLGVTFLDEKGNLPEGITTWQFNFKFNLTEDMYAEDSVDLLQVWSLEPFFSRFFVLEKKNTICPQKFRASQTVIFEAVFAWMGNFRKSKGKGRG